MPRLPPLCPGHGSRDHGGDKAGVSGGSSGYITSSAASSTSGAGGQKKASRALPGGKESSVVRFL